MPKENNAYEKIIFSKNEYERNANENQPLQKVTN